MTLTQAKAKLKAARADNRRKNRLLIESANQLSMRQIAPRLIAKIKSALGENKC